LWRGGVLSLFAHSKIVFDQIKLFKVAVRLRDILRFSFTNKAISSGITMTAPGFTSRFFRSTALSGAQPEQSTDIKSKKSVRKKSPTQFSSLEPRVLFDAAAERTAAAIADAAFVEHGEIADPIFHDLLVALDASVAVPVDALPWHEQPTVENLNAAAQEIVFIDSGVEDPAAIAASAPGGAAIVYLQSGRDGLDQIAAYLSGRTDVSAIHIVSHGEEGDLILGGSKVDATALALHSADLAVIKSALTDNGDILLYGCDVAKGSDGAAFVKAIATATGADVAASTDVTGSADLGGNWVLENRVGVIDSRILDARDWHGVLAPLTITITGAPVITGIFGTDATTGLPITGVGGTALWSNAGFVGSTAIDLKATVVSTTTAGMAFITQGDDASIVLTSAGDVFIKWEIFAAGTNIPAVGSPNFNIVDVDGAGGVPNSREIVVPQLNGLTAYTLDAITHEVVNISAAGVNVSGTQNEIANPPVSISQVQFSWQNVSSWTVKYSLNSAAGFGNAVFRHMATAVSRLLRPTLFHCFRWTLTAIIPPPRERLIKPAMLRGQHPSI
jgi:Domain of unknown function (DUF4347)